MPLFHGLPNGFLFELVVISGLSLWMLLSWLNPAIQWRLQNSGKPSFVVELARRSPPFCAILWRKDRGHFSSIGGPCHGEEKSLVPSAVVDFSIATRQRVR